ncbi:MAG: hypothetical protein LBG70_03230 [Bifidobacteriaceae bacterium]|nr:hypothetical protein [Bifidobacteriaceae bacterium]
MLLSGCVDASSAHVAPKNPYHAEVEQILKHANSDYVKQVLADGHVSAVEFEETLTSFAGCLREAGIAAVIDELDSGARRVIYPSNYVDSDVVRGCEKKWDDGIVYLAQMQLENPDNEPFEDLQAAQWKTRFSARFVS